MKQKEKSSGDGYWFTRDSRTCELPVSRGQKITVVGAPGSRPRRAARRLYAKLLESKKVATTGFKAWLRAQA